ncbi:hypothetical protein TVAG_279960 [Trichomonas vaginalis G3]|uniref:Uncharacterized protein n=1 Tax=Trichomonas vaginalis (strain ATCC PRA-98 / G3) TaxID=412133 RepID=A2FBK9_TRIV3|nr:hypothetical protein TVAGG3_0809160 [Trichomonas vaginalis G3]EAX97695.1 hypothetical protein TVAG_279960 [Trichomonas vaginalis G3]KAI5497074.1 hypothetical protein TVAGG3_0809160 [Trichomonas vaginalis G3]|eukprot:XP_001310625.1 hypothetical protein [Trichomonas vaginalis G3]
MTGPFIVIKISNISFDKEVYDIEYDRIFDYTLNIEYFASNDIDLIIWSNDSSSRIIQESIYIDLNENMIHGLGEITDIYKKGKNTLYFQLIDKSTNITSKIYNKSFLLTYKPQLEITHFNTNEIIGYVTHRNEYNEVIVKAFIDDEEIEFCSTYAHSIDIARKEFHLELHMDRNSNYTIKIIAIDSDSVQSDPEFVRLEDAYIELLDVNFNKTILKPNEHAFVVTGNGISWIQPKIHLKINGNEIIIQEEINYKENTNEFTFSISFYFHDFYKDCSNTLQVWMTTSNGISNVIENKFCFREMTDNPLSFSSLNTVLKHIKRR